MQLGACVAVVKSFNPSPQMMQKLRRRTSELEREGTGHKIYSFTHYVPLLLIS